MSDRKFPYWRDESATSLLTEYSKRRKGRCAFPSKLQIVFIAWICLSVFGTFILPQYFQSYSIRIPTGQYTTEDNRPQQYNPRGEKLGTTGKHQITTIHFVLANHTHSSSLNSTKVYSKKHPPMSGKSGIVVDIKYANKPTPTSIEYTHTGNQIFPDSVDITKTPIFAPIKLPPPSLIPEDTSKTVKFNYGYDEVIAKKVSITRTIPDGRHKSCKVKKYSVKNKVSIIISVFNEAWHVLLRTLHSIMQRTPEKLISEVVIIDDCSDEILTYMKTELQEYVKQWGSKVRVIRNEKREGLIRSRNQAARSAKGEVLVFLDSHVEVNKGWLEPLLDKIENNWHVVAVPVLDTISPTKWDYTAAEQVPKTVDAFLWNLKEARTIAQKQPINGSGAEAVETPVSSHGQYAVSKKFFELLGSYDPEMEVIGGENFEMSFKTWMCGGKMLLVPCSRVGHLKRGRHPSFKDVDSLLKTQRNLMRVAKVWMEEYSQYFEDSDINFKEMDYGDITDRLTLKNELKCKSFEWYIGNVFPQLFNPKGRLIADSDIMNLGMDDDLCLDAVTAKGAELTMFPCHGKGGNQRWFYTTQGELRRYDLCLDNWGLKKIKFYPCHGQQGNQLWVYLSETNLFKHAKTGECLAAVSKDTIQTQACDESKFSQKWILRNFNATAYEEAGFGI